ncbi:uncharacterized protein LOC121384586 isoform X2 [Gigantopelta aegis]|uniref:uncharacterized protein LOC121384586 isoform X2 n=1 Tax=Gigantopelta aegis TaxID=1735272 RepID=UPI001B888F70|nr:uncharacterized protein LOC121384586 isoform X2 [Gigantopelta aegis]
MYRWTDGKPPRFVKWKAIDPQTKQSDGAAVESCVTWTTYGNVSWWENVGCGDPIGKGFVCETKARNNTEQLGSPVVHASTRAPPLDGLFNCSNGEIIWKSRTCDGHPDCFDGSHEQRCGYRLAALGGVPIAGEIYAWTAVFILPVNSALNPLLYTLSAYRQKRVLVKTAHGGQNVRKTSLLGVQKIICSNSSHIWKVPRHLRWLPRC